MSEQTHKPGCDALGGYGHGVGPCSCGALASPAGAAVEPVACRGKNCGTTTADHSAECIAEHEAAYGMQQSAAGRAQAGAVAIINGEQATALSLLGALIDIYDDAENKAPEHRCYLEGAWGECLSEARAFLTAPGAAIAAREQDPDDELLVACIKLNGATLTVEPNQLADMFGTDDEQHTYELTFKRMTRAAYEALGEFNGF